MEPRPTDRRVRRTRERLRQAMVQLLLEKEPQAITVRELTDLADVNRGTFYTHYKDIYDMLEQMENEMFRELEALLDSYSAESILRDLTAIFEDVFAFVGRNREMIQVFVGNQAADRFSRRLNALIYTRCVDNWREIYTRVEADAGYTMEFVVAGAVGLLRAWVERGSRESPAEMARLANRLIGSGAYPARE